MVQLNSEDLRIAIDLWIEDGDYLFEGESPEDVSTEELTARIVEAVADGEFDDDGDV